MSRAIKSYRLSKRDKAEKIAKDKIKFISFSSIR